MNPPRCSCPPGVILGDCPVSYDNAGHETGICRGLTEEERQRLDFETEVKRRADEGHTDHCPACTEIGACVLHRPWKGPSVTPLNEKIGVRVTPEDVRAAVLGAVAEEGLLPPPVSVRVEGTVVHVRAELPPPLPILEARAAVAEVPTGGPKAVELVQQTLDPSERWSDAFARNMATPEQRRAFMAEVRQLATELPVLVLPPGTVFRAVEPSGPTGSNLTQVTPPAGGGEIGP